MRARVLIAAASAAALLAACEGESFDAGEFSVSGEWLGEGQALVGTAPNQTTVTWEIALDLEQTEEEINGTGELRSNGQMVPLQVRGDWSYPSVELDFGGGAVVPFTFQSRFDVDTLAPIPPDTARLIVNDPDSLVGTLSGSGFPTSTRFVFGRVSGAP